MAREGKMRHFHAVEVTSMKQEVRLRRLVEESADKLRAVAVEHLRSLVTKRRGDSSITFIISSRRGHESLTCRSLELRWGRRTPEVAQILSRCQATDAPTGNVTRGRPRPGGGAPYSNATICSKLIAGAELCLA